MGEELAQIADQVAIWLMVDALPLFADLPSSIWEFLVANSLALSHFALVLGVYLLWRRVRAADQQAAAANKHAEAANEQARVANEQAGAANEQARVANVQAKTAEQGQFTDRFTKSIEQLGNEKNMAVRLGGIYALERLSKDSPGDHWTIMEVLTAYLRENATADWARDMETAEDKLAVAGMDLDAQFAMTFLSGKEGPLKFRPETDIQAVLTVLGRRSGEARQREIAARRRLDLAVIDLRGAFLQDAHLEYACLKGADLRLASLRDAHLDGAELHQAILLGAHFLTQEQLNSASGDESTVLPVRGRDGLPVKRPDHWLKSNPSPATPPPSPTLQPEPQPDNPPHTSR